MATREGTQPRRATRRAFLKTVTAAGVGAAASRWYAVAGSREDSAVLAATPLRRGGTLKIAEIGEPLTLDAPATTATLTAVITLPIFEGLFAFDAGWRIRPDLAAGYSVSKDGLMYTITLRSNVSFHNGKMLTADDVVASVNRWGKVNPQAAAPYGAVDTVQAAASDTVVIKMKTPFAPFLGFLALAGACGIMPKEVIDGIGPGGLKQYVGTGPYKFVEWAPDRYVHLTRFDQYAARTDPASLFAGRKEALADDIFYYPVTQVATRVAGVQSGDYDIADGINQDAYVPLKADPRVTVGLLPGYYLIFFLNKKQGLMTNQKLRQAVEVALDMQPIMQATFGDPQLYSLDASLYPKGTPWYTTAGATLVQRPQHGPGEGPREGGRVLWADHPVAHDPGLRLHVQEHGGRIDAAPAGRVQGGPAGPGLGDGPGSAHQADRMGDICDVGRLRAGPLAAHALQLDLPGVVGHA